MENMKLLKSQFHERKWNDYPTTTLRISDLWASVPKAEVHKGKPFYSRLIKDIDENGLHFPLLVVHATRRELAEQIKKSSDAFSDLPFDEAKDDLNIKLYVIWGGSNRVRVAEELGYTHIDCVIIESFDAAYKLQPLHRQPYAEKYYAAPPLPETLQVPLPELASEINTTTATDDSVWKKAVPRLLEKVQHPEAKALDWINLGVCLEAQAKRKQAAKAFIKAQELEPERRNTYFDVLRNLYFDQDFDQLVEFVTHCKRVSQKIPTLMAEEPFFIELFSKEPFKTLADPKHTLPAIKTEPEEAEEKTAPKPDSGNLMSEYQTLLKNESLLPVLQNAISNNPTDESAWLTYGFCLQSLGRHNEAVEVFFKAQELNPANEAVYPAIFDCLYQTQNFDQLLNFAQYCNAVSPEINESIARNKNFSALFERTEFKQLITAEDPASAPILPTPKDRPANMNKTFITGVDGKQEWMLKWWYRNITKHNPAIHITICDMGGMSPEVRKWARAHADHFIQYPKHPQCAWFYKTQALIDSPYEYTCWIDVDCETLRPIDDIFNYTKLGKIGVTADPMHARNDPSEHWWATGVCLIQKSPKLLLDWHNITIQAKTRGDQEALHLLLSQTPQRKAEITEIPMEYQWLRLQLARKLNNENKKVIHWTGPSGKNHIRHTLLLESDLDFTIPEQTPVAAV